MEGLSHDSYFESRFTETLIKHVAQVGFDPRYGARPLQRAIEEQVVTPPAERLVREPELSDANMEMDLADSLIQLRVKPL